MEESVKLKEPIKKCECASVWCEHNPYCVFCFEDCGDYTFCAREEDYYEPQQ